LTLVLSSPILSAIEALAALAAGEQGEGRRCAVKIRTKEKCPKCKRSFQETPLGLLCPKCFTVPRRFFIDLSWKGRRIRVYSFKDGQPLSSWELAQRARQLIEHELESKTFDPTRWVKSDVKKFLFENLAVQYLAERKKQMKPSGFQAKESWFKGRLIPYFGKEDVREIRSYHLHEYLNSLLEEGTLSASSIKKVFVELRAFFNWCRKREIIFNVPAIPEIKNDERPIRWLSPEQQTKILSFIPKEHQPIFEFLFLTGARIGEARAIMWDAVNLEEGYILIFRAFSLDRLVESPKEKKPKVIPLVGRIAEIVQEQAKKKEGLFVFFYKHKSKTIPYPHKRLLAIFHQAREKAGIGEISLYEAVRHSFAMQRLKGGYSYEEVGAALGHSSPQTTRRYARLQAEMVKNIFETPTKVVSLEEARKKRSSANRQ